VYECDGELRPEESTESRREGHPMADIPHRENLLEALRSAVQEELETVSEEHQAFVRVAADWLGYDDLEEDDFVDGARDRGVDFWYATDPGFDIFQIKSHELGPLGRVRTDRFGADGVQDLQRILAFLLDDKGGPAHSKKLELFRRRWEYSVTRRRMGEAPEPLQVNLGLILFGAGLSDAAQEEYDAFVRSLGDSRQHKGVAIEVRTKLYTVDDIMLTRWRQENRAWQDKKGRKRNQVDLYPEVGKWISGRHHAVFHCRAIDLVMAFENFGYQIFEPNVRAHINKSKVNMAIRDSLMHRASRKEFHFLNNGLTVICKSFSKPTGNRASFRLTEPGVVNGLQTVVALHEAYNVLSPTDQKHLEDNCRVLVRLLKQTAVRDVDKVVLASNTQNPMQARNLRSNTTEQVYYEKLFAEKGWFYGRKQGAWEAFSGDPSRWRTLARYRKSNFQASPSVGRPRYRRVDNEDIGQTWLAFIGFCSDAVHNKRYIFDEDAWYELIFLHRTPKHAADYNFEASGAREDWTDQAPEPMLMLVSFFARQFAKSVALSARENRELACKRLELDPARESKEHLEVKLAEDDDYLLEQVLSAMSFVFVEFFGYMLYRALGQRIHDVGWRLTRNGSLKYLYETNDFDTVARNMRAGRFQEDDLIAIAWWVFRHTIEQLMGGAWKQSYQTARNRTRFNHSIDTRRRIYKQLDQLNDFMEKRQLTQVWAAGIPPRTRLYQFVYDVLVAV
jgi:hypothetical protein